MYGFCDILFNTRFFVGTRKRTPATSQSQSGGTNNIMRTILCLLKTFIYLLGALPDQHRIHRLQKKGDHLTAWLFIQARVRHWAIAMLRFASVTTDVFGREHIPKGPVLFAPNHQSDWDIMLAETYLDQCGIVSKQEIGRIPLVRQWTDLLGVVFIDRDDPRQTVRALKDGEKQLLEGRNFIIFAEGTRSKGEDLGEFKTGSLRIAIKHGIPIVPVSIDGSYKIMEANNGKWIRPAHVIMTIQPPIQTAGLDKAAQRSIGDDIRQSILEGRETGRRLYSEKESAKLDEHERSTEGE